jgi:SNF2 family DNA or RNA helicase
MKVAVMKARANIVVQCADPKFVQSALKSVPGYGWSKRHDGWTLPLDPLVYEDLMPKLEAIDGAEVRSFAETQDWYSAASARVSAAIAARTAKDFDLQRVAFAPRMHVFQRRGTGFLISAKRALLTDEMGLGKTIESMAAIEELKLADDGPVLIVCNKAMLYTWQQEIDAWCQRPSAILTHCRELDGRNTAPGIYIINWSKLTVRGQVLTKVPWLGIIADESHRAKSRKAKQTQALWKLQALYKFALTGTPIRNDVTDLWSQLHWLDPARFPSFWKFFDQYADWEIEWMGRGREVKKVRGIANADQLDTAMKSIMFGRKLADVEIDLPPVVGPKRVVVELESDQRKAYERMREEFVAWIESEPDDQVLARNWIAQLIRLKQIAGSLGIFWDGRDDSAKFDAYEELVNEMPDDEKWVVYSQYTTVLDQLERRLRMRGEAYALLTGPKNYVWGPNRGEVKMDRGALVKAFQNNSSVKHFVGSIGAGGEGITLTAARRMALLDLPWTPAEIEQVQRRLIRIGQQRTVFLYHILAKDTVDFITILPTIRRKQEIIDIVQKGQAA